MENLLTWNCKHIANAIMRSKMEIVCAFSGCEPPIICTPAELNLMWQDPVVQGTRKLKEEYAAKFDNSKAMYQDILIRQAQHKERLVSFQPRKPRLCKGVA